MDRDFNVRNLSIQLPDKTDGVPEFQRLGRHNRANGGSGGIPDGYRHISLVVSLGRSEQKRLQPGKVGLGDLLGSGKLLQESIDGVHVKGRNQFFQFGEQDTDQTGDRLLELGPLPDFIKSVSCE